MAYYTTKTGERISPWNMLVLPLLLLFMIVPVLFIYFNFEHMQLLFSPDNTLMIVRPRLASILAFVPWCFPGMGASVWFFHVLGNFIPFLRREFAAERLGNEIAYDASFRFCKRFTVISTCCAILCTILVAGTFTAVSSNGMLQRSFPGIFTKQYNWDDIVEVKADCRDVVSKSGSQLDLSYEVIMSDGASADLLDNKLFVFPTIYMGIRHRFGSGSTIRCSTRITESGIGMLCRSYRDETRSVIMEALMTAKKQSGGKR